MLKIGKVFSQKKTANFRKKNNNQSSSCIIILLHVYDNI